MQSRNCSVGKMIQFDKVSKKQTIQKKSIGRRQGRIENSKNPWSEVGPQNGQAEVRKNQSYSDRTKIDSKQGAVNGNFSVRSDWTDFFVCQEN